MDGQQTSDDAHPGPEDFAASPSLLEEFAAVIAHELATPLSIIDMAAQTALRHDAATPDAEHQEILEMIRRNTKLAQMLLYRLALARNVEADTVVLDLATVDLAELVEESVGDLAEAIVRNHGSGVTPGDTDAIFEKFHRGETNAPGAGLGLFISRGLARAHGGDLTVKAAEHIGSEFRLTLPLGA